MGYSKSKGGTELFTQKELAVLVGQIAMRIKRQELEDLTIVCVLKASFIFASDLMRSLPAKTRIEFVFSSSYKGSEAARHAPEVSCPLASLTALCDRNVVIVDTVFDTGNTMLHVQRLLQESCPRTIQTCCLFWKRNRDSLLPKPDIFGIELGPDDFIVGYGMDLKEELRGQREVDIR